jgi:hypothetical protein
MDRILITWQHRCSCADVLGSGGTAPLILNLGIRKSLSDQIDGPAGPVWTRRVREKYPFSVPVGTRTLVLQPVAGHNTDWANPAKCFWYRGAIFLPLTQPKWSRDSSERLGYGLDDWYSIPGKGGFFLFATASRPALGPTQPPIQWVPGTHSPGVKRLVRETDHSRPYGAEVKNAWGYTSTSPYVSMAWR